MDEHRWIATRVLRSSEQGPTVTVSIGVPICIDQGYSVCPVVIDGPDGQIRADGHGIDTVQALLCGFVWVRRVLAESYPDYSYEGGFEGDNGFPRIVAEGSLAYRRHLDDILDEQARIALEAAIARSAGKT